MQIKLIHGRRTLTKFGDLMMNGALPLPGERVEIADEPPLVVKRRVFKRDKSGHWTCRIVLTDA